MAQPPLTSSVPVLLLKTKSTPADLYEDLFLSPTDDHNNPYIFEPLFIPVLQHSFMERGMATTRDILHRQGISTDTDALYGGLIFTSQRAVDAFSALGMEMANENGSDEQWRCLQDVPVYSVGPATTRALKSISQEPLRQIFGEHTGNGDALASLILEHYGRWYQDRVPKPPLLFLVGEQRRRIVPDTLMNAALPSDRRIQVDEVVVYRSGVLESFPNDFAAALETTADRPMRWIVVFTPAGCEDILRGLGWLDESTGRVRRNGSVERKTSFVATIGPTTRNHLRNKFGFEPDVCAEEPSAEGVRRGILQFLCSHRIYPRNKTFDNQVE